MFLLQDWLGFRRAVEIHADICGTPKVNMRGWRSALKGMRAILELFKGSQKCQWGVQASLGFRFCNEGRPLCSERQVHPVVGVNCFAYEQRRA